MLKQIFGPSKEEIWRQLAEQIEGHYVNGGWLGQDKVEAQHNNWVITLDTHVVSTGKTTVVYTQLQAPFQNIDQFRFSISRRNIFTGLGKFFGMQDIEIGEPQFDHNFVIKGNNEEKVKRFLSDSLIRELLAQQPTIHFEIKVDSYLFSRNYPEGVDILYFRDLGIIKDLDRLKSLYNLFSATLDQLGQLGTATGYTPALD